MYRLHSRCVGLIWTAGRASRVCVVRAGLAVAVIALALLPAVTGALPPGGASSARADDVTTSLNNLRTGWDPNEPGLSPSVVGGGTFGQVFSTVVNGQVYAQPLVVGSTVIVATENDKVYGLNAATGVVKWSDSLGTPYNITVCGNLTPNIGITGSPVYDPTTGSVYLIAQVMRSSGPSYRLFGISAQSGNITKRRWIGGTPTNDSSIAFNGAQQLERPGLLLMNGWVYAAFGSNCDRNPYVGFVFGVNLSNGRATLWSDESGVTDNRAGIWQSGGGLMSDGAGRIFFASGNGVSPAPGPGIAPPGQLAESTVRLAVQSNGSLAARDFFSPANAPSLDAADTDFGSGGPVGLPFGTSTYPDLLVQAGKDGRIFVLNRDNLGGREQGAGGTDAAVSEAGPYAGQWGHPAVFANTPTLTASDTATANDYVYYLGRNSYLRVLKAGADSSGTPTLSDVANSSSTFGYTSGSPVVTSNGTRPASAIVWVVYASGPTGSSAALDAFAAAPPSTCTASAPCTLSPIWSAPIGTASKFTIPATSNGMVYVGTRDGHVLGFGVTTAAPLVGAEPLTFSHTAVGTSTTSDVTVTASANVTVSGVSVDATTTPNPFTVGQVTETVKGGNTPVPVTFPVALSRGDALHAPVTFTPAGPGGTTGGLSFATQTAAFPSVIVPLSGDGTQTGLSPTTSTLSFHLVLNDGMTLSDVPVGTAVPLTADIINSGTTPQTVTSVIPPAAPFTAKDLPAPGTVINPGQSLTVQVTFAPQHAGPATGLFTVTGDRGTSATVDLSGTGLTPVSQFTASPRAVNFGAVPRGQTATATFGIANTGNLPATVTRPPPLAAPFRAPNQVAKGLPVNSGNDLVITVTFAPARTGTFTGIYQFTWADRFGAHALDVPLTGTGTG
jgi:PQQ-like domain/HYDIN/CFA65/VesB-like, Ig-like domain